jgi:ATP-dependent helicase/nuclease subunit A
MGRLTPSQQRAVDMDHTNILVSAGAGSGKTTVLSERVIRKLNDGVAIDHLIILTFTNAAAAEMKSRIKAKISSLPHLHEQLKRMDNAIISTFDSFAQRIVKENHYRLGRPQSITIADPLFVELERDRLIDQLMEERYATQEQTWIQTVVETFDKTDQTIKEAVKLIAAGIAKMPHRENFQNTFSATFFSPDFAQKIRDSFVVLLQEDAAYADPTYQDMTAFAQSCGNEKVADFVESIADLTEQLTQSESIADFHATMQRAEGLKAPRFGKDESELRDAFKAVFEPWKDVVQTIKKRLRSLFIETDADLFEALANPSQRVITTFELATEFLKKWPLVVSEKRLYGFGDVFNDALILLENHPDLRLKYQTEINEIMVDEYQDTNDLQDYLLSLIAKGNLFLVGDVKQSIYGFRDANPTNFMAKAKAYEQGRDGVVITLAENFRSRQEIIAGLNAFFERLMDVSLGGANYRQGHGLVFGNRQYLESPTQATDPYGIRINVYDVPEGDGTPKALIEGRIIAHDIRSKIDSRFMVRDLGNQCDRLATFRDFAIIVDRKSGFHHYQKALKDAQIPVLVIGDEDFIAAAEILVCTNAFRLIAFFQPAHFEAIAFKRSFYGLARSFVCEIADEDIIRLFLDHPFKQFADLQVLANHPVFSLLYHKLTSLAILSATVSLADLFSAMAKELNIYHAIALLDDPQSAEEKLLYLHEKLNQFEAMDLPGAIRYFEAIEQSDHLDIEFQKPLPEGYNAVTLLTMHKSKGLEYPICYYPGLDKRFYRPENKSFFQFDPEYGIVSKAWNEGYYDTALHTLLEVKRRKTDLSERIRLLYVALTRAKEQAIMILPKTATNPSERIAFQDNGTLTDAIRLRATAFSDWLTIVPVASDWMISVPLVTETNGLRTLDNQQETNPPIVIHERSILPIPIETTSYSKPAQKQPTQAMRDALRFGDSLHKTLESLDFLRPDWRNIPESMQPILKRFLHIPLLQTPGAMISKEVPLMDEFGRIAILDLLVETPTEIHIIDYKTKTIRKPEYDLQVFKYMTLLQTRTGKPVFGWLYSLLDGQIIAVEGSL